MCSSDLVADTVTEATLPNTQRTWIGNIVGLKDLQVSAIMTPRPDLVAMQATTPVRDAVRQALQHGFSRYPVYREKVDEIVGVFYVKDALRVPVDSTAANLPVETMLRPPLFVPESMGVAQLLRRFQADKVHMAIVLDEYGCTAGLVSVEDALSRSLATSPMNTTPRIPTPAKRSRSWKPARSSTPQAGPAWQPSTSAWAATSRTMAIGRPSLAT